MSEASILADIRLALGRTPHCLRLWRNNSGAALDPTGRLVRYGVGIGGSDLLGWRSVNGVAVFCAVEVKDARGRITPDQQRFIDVVTAAGGYAGVARSVDDARAILRM